MDFGLTGRPTQFHAVPVEERAVDRNGKKLPYALEWPESVLPLLRCRTMTY